jgi:hypothetical protein
VCCYQRRVTSPVDYEAEEHSALNWTCCNTSHRRWLRKTGINQCTFFTNGIVLHRVERIQKKRTISILKC